MFFKELATGISKDRPARNVRSSFSLRFVCHICLSSVIPNWAPSPVRNLLLADTTAPCPHSTTKVAGIPSPSSVKRTPTKRGSWRRIAMTLFRAASAEVPGRGQRMRYQDSLRRLGFSIILAASCVSAWAKVSFDKTLHVTSVETQTGSRVSEGSGGTYTWHKMIGQVDGQGYSFKTFCRWRWSRCNWLLPGEFPARWINRSTLEIEYHDNKGQVKAEKIYVLDVFDTTPESKPNQVSPTSTPQENKSENPLDCNVTVVSTPDGADVEIDGSFVGNTPSTVKVALGEHSVAVKKTGYETWERKLKVSGGDVKLSAELERQK